MLTTEKLDKQLSGQAGSTTPFMKIGDTSHSGKKISFKVQALITEQLENLTSVVYNMSMERKKIVSCLSPKFIKREVEDRPDRILVPETEVEHLIVTDKILDPTIGKDHKIGNVGMIVEEETIDVKSQNYSRNGSRDRGRQNFRGNNNRSIGLTPKR